MGEPTFSVKIDGIPFSGSEVDQAIHDSELGLIDLLHLVEDTGQSPLPKGSLENRTFYERKDGKLHGPKGKYDKVQSGADLESMPKPIKG